MRRFLLFIGLDCLVFTGLLVWMTTSPTPANETIFTIYCVLLVPALMLAAFHWLWRPMFAAYPAQTPADDAPRRRFQSFAIGFVNMSLSIHVAVDDTYLHLQPLKVWQWLGAAPASIPWTALTPEKPKGRMASFGKVKMYGPRWCMELVSQSGDK